MRNPLKRRKHLREEEAARLAESMGKLAEALNRVSDPQTWRDLVEIAAVRMASALPTFFRAALPTGPEVTATPATPVTLSTEERTRLADRVVEALSPQLEDFRRFVQAAVAELPRERLVRAAQLIEQGAKPQLARRHGCVFLDLEGGNLQGSDSFYLSL